MSHSVKPLILLIPAICFAGCSLFRSGTPVRIESSTKVQRSIERNLLALASTRDFVGEENVGPALIRKIALNDQQLMTRFMHSRGYYDASISAEIFSTGTSMRIVYNLDPGPLYMLNDLTLICPEDYDGMRPDTKNLRKGAATTASIRENEKALQLSLRNDGYPEARVAVEQVTVDHATRLVDVAYKTQPGRYAHFGKLSTEGFENLRTSYARKAKPWQEGGVYNQSLVDEMERRMAGGGVFSMIDIEHDKEAAVENENDYHLRLEVKERPPRTIQVGLGYRTDTGSEVSARWQHRNALGGGENFILRSKWSESGLEAETRVTVPFFRRGDQSWSTSLTYTREDTDAYESESYKGESLITREVSEEFTLRSGFAIRYLDEEQSRSSDYFYLGSLPVRFFWDSSNDPLDAVKGLRLLISTEPFQSIEGRDPFFWKHLISLNGYVPLDDDETFSLALRLTGGAINANTLNDVPAELRYYAGGAQSVRGYAYQSLSPRDTDGNVVGGLSLAETSLELRLRFGKSIGAVAFVDGGTAFLDETPDLEESFLWGAGLGFRFFTAVGPVRLDAAFPIDRRDGIDDAWQFYVSLGQSF